jgi:hypothetical protein
MIGKTPFTKTDFIQYLHCAKSLWLAQNKPEFYPVGEMSAFVQKLAAEGYEVEAYVKQHVAKLADNDAYSFQAVFETDDGLFARADMVRQADDGSIDICEIKSSTRVKDSGLESHLKDAAFQAVAAQRAGNQVGKIFIVHLNNDYVRSGDIDPSALVTFADETVRVKALLHETEREIDSALALLSQAAIDEQGCTCLYLGRSNHCDSFEYFNSDIPNPSIYSLPRLSGKKLAAFVDEGRFDLSQIELDEVSRLQQLVLRSFQDGQPDVDMADIENFLSVLQYPLYFLDYETYMSAVPIADGLGPQEHLPFQFSLHVLHQDGQLAHFEYLADAPAIPAELVAALRQHIGPTGSIVTWNRAFENTQNKRMAQTVPEAADFLLDLVDRTVDLMDVFKTGYVDIRLNGSTSIKKVLPVIVPELSYDGMDVSDGTSAMESWDRMINESDAAEREKLRQALLNYCKLDTLAMVRIFQFVEGVVRTT